MLCLEGKAAVRKRTSEVVTDCGPSELTRFASGIYGMRRLRQRQSKHVCPVTQTIDRLRRPGRVVFASSSRCEAYSQSSNRPFGLPLRWQRLMWLVIGVSLCRHYEPLLATWLSTVFSEWQAR